jgi:integration host factor subunit alpha
VITAFFEFDDHLITRYIFSMSRSVIRTNIAEAIYKNIGLSRNESADIVATILEEMSLALERGDKVKISSFGSFSVNSKNQRIGRNPKTGQEVPITPRRVLTFRPSHILRDSVNSNK